MNIEFSSRITPFMPLPSMDFIARGNKGTPSEKFFGEREFFSSGRGALLRAVSAANPDGKRRIFLPRFFCPQIISLLGKKYKLEFYEDIPSENMPRYCTIDARSGDILVAVNYFGLRERNFWESWKSENPDVYLIEDHSHAPFSIWATSTKADCAFASLRKWTSLPDGAWLWRKGIKPSKMFSKGGSMSEFASRFLEGAALEKFGIYDEKLYYSGETVLYTSPSVSRMSEYSFAVLKNLNVEKMSRVRGKSFEAFVSALEMPEGVREIRGGKTPEDLYSLYFPSLKFESSDLRDRVYARLRELDIFACIYWGGLGNDTSEAAWRESSTTFQLPLDFRHSVDDAKNLASVINSLFRDFA